ncbi:MAG TPA: hypothetical protein VEV41_24900 [Terriglobales bacterium]|nr:hypothetical protein [Terriglobales bacterium]
MVKAHHRTRCFLGLASGMMLAAVLSKGQTPATTTIADVVYRADGTPASGVLLISWPSFSTADNKPVAAGTKNVVLGPQGTFSVDLVPNSGAIPGDSL